MGLQILCTLTALELQERRRTILDSIRANAVECVELPNGYSYRFAASPDILSKLSQLVELESQCCQFLTFKIVVAPNQPITLEVSGPPGARDAISDFLGTSGRFQLAPGGLSNTLNDGAHQLKKFIAGS